MSEGNGYVSLEALVAPRKPPERDVEVPAFGGKVRLKGFSVRERSRFEASVQGKNRDEIRERLLVATIVKPAGLTAAHIKVIGDSDCTALEPLVNAALELTGMTQRDVESLEKKDESSSETPG